MKLKLKHTVRGFAYYEFQDRYGDKCSLQKSSLATEDAIWFGIDDPSPKVMARDAAILGVSVNETEGWVPYPLPEQVLITTRMHLTRKQVKKLLPILQHFVDTGKVGKV